MERIEGETPVRVQVCQQFPIGPYYVDFLCRASRLVVEIDGSQHAQNEYDERRNEFMREQGYSVIRFWSSDGTKNVGGICVSILAALEGRFVGDVRALDMRYVAGRNE